MTHKYLLYKPKKAIIISKSSQEDLERLQVPFKCLNMGGKDVVAVKDDLPNYYKLKEVLPDLECPIHRHYDWPNVDNSPNKPAMQHQKDGAAFVIDNYRSWNTSEMGTGKSVTMLYAADYLLKEGIIKSVLVFSPISTLNRVWSDALFNTFLHTGYQWVVLHTAPEKRVRLLNSDSTFYIANHDFLKVATEKSFDKSGGKVYKIKPGYEVLKQFDLILFDESACLRNGDTYTYEAFREILEPHQRLVLMTGTPCPTAPTDVFWPSKLVNPNATPKYFGRFRQEVMYSEKHGGFEKWFPRADAAPKVFAAMTPCFRVKKSDVIDLPPVVWEKLEVPMSKTQEKAFKSMLKDMTADIGGRQVDAINAAAKIGKLHQILCGAVKDGDDYLEMDCKPRLELTMEAIGNSLSKTIVVVPYKGILRYLTEKVQVEYECELVNGDVTPSERDRIFKRFKEDDSLRVLLVHPKCMAHGLTLIEASTMVFYSSLRSGNEVYRQVLERMNRPGQKNKMTIVQIGSHAVEWKMYEHLDNLENFQQSALSIYDDLVANMI